jgi:2-C-methyl-D-erythritol 4-phosphate cytidylyltransferase
VETWAIVVAGGTGTRFGGPKQFAELHGRPLLSWSLDTARRVCDGVVVVLPGSGAEPSRWDADVLVQGGSTRSASVRAGLAAVPGSAQVIVVHDAARPLASTQLWKAVVSEVDAGADGAIPVCQLRDTVRQRTEDGRSVTLDRAALFAVQTPQAFRAPILRQAHSAGGDATDDSALVEAVGGRIALVDGAAENLKVTTPADLVIASVLGRNSL